MWKWTFHYEMRGHHGCCFSVKVNFKWIFELHCKARVLQGNSNQQISEIIIPLLWEVSTKGQSSNWRSKVNLFELCGRQGYVERIQIHLLIFIEDIMYTKPLNTGKFIIWHRNSSSLVLIPLAVLPLVTLTCICLAPRCSPPPPLTICSPFPHVVFFLLVMQN